MKMTTVLQSSLIISLVASNGFGQASAPKSKWGWLPPKVAAQSSAQPGDTAALMAALRMANKGNSRDSVPLQDRLEVLQTLPGTWLIRITPQGDGAPPPFVVLGQFSSEGNFVSTESDLYVPPAGTPGQGVWAPAPSRSFDLVEFAFLFDEGNFVGMSKVTSHGQLDQTATSFKGTYKVEFFDTKGVLQFTGPGVFDGFVVGIEP